MAPPIRPNYKQTYLFPHSWEEVIAADHPVRFIRAFVDALDWEALWKAEERGYRVVVPIRDKHWAEGEIKQIGDERKKGEMGYKGTIEAAKG